MRMILTLVLSVFISVSFAYGQSYNDSLLFDFGPCDVTVPEYPGGLDSLKSALNHFMRDANVHQDTVVLVEFSINIKGGVVNPKIIQSAGKDLDSFCLAFFETSPKWTPSISKSTKEAFVFKMQMPIWFYIQINKE